MKRRAAIIALQIVLLLTSSRALAQSDERSPYTGPIIDMHMHASVYYLELGTDGEPLPFDCYPAPCVGRVTAAVNEEDALRMTVSAMDRHNVVLGFLTGDSQSRLGQWRAAAPGRFILSPRIGPPGVPPPASLREAYQAGRLGGMGEIATQYDGYRANNRALAPYFVLAEEMDVPTLIHNAGIGAPTPDFRVSNGDPRFLEEVIVAHPNLRLYAENCGFPFAESMIAMMYQHPRLYCDVSTITWIIPREAFHDFLERLIRAGLHHRIMFGSDQMLLPETIGMAIEAVQSAEFLTAEQREAIFYGNATRFLRLSDEEIARHHGKQQPFRIIDMHFHGAFAFGEQEVQPIEPWLKAFDERGVEKAVLTSFFHQLEVWAPQDRDRFIPSLWFPCMTQFVQECFPGGEPFPDPAWVRKEIEAGRIAMLGEVGTQMLGIYPSSPELEPYFSLAEEFDIPFSLHMGPGPHQAVTDGSIYKEFPDFEIAAGNPLELEDVLRRHPDLRLYIMHAGWPMIDELLTLLWHHPNDYVDLGHLQVAIPRAEYYDYLERIVNAGYGNRVMYGSDVGRYMFDGSTLTFQVDVAKVVTAMGTSAIAQVQFEGESLWLTGTLER